MANILTNLKTNIDRIADAVEGGGGGGGGSDFSVATLTFNNRAYDLNLELATFTENGGSEISVRMPPSEVTITPVILYKGKAKAFSQENIGQAPGMVYTGSIEWIWDSEDESGYYLITGDCSITTPEV